MEWNGSETSFEPVLAMQLSSTQTLQLWHDVALSQVRNDAPDLSLRQMTILLSIYLEPPPHTVRGLAQKLRVTKPVITRALDSMGRMKLVARKRDPQDRRNVLIQRTVEGVLFLENLSDIIAEKIEGL